MTVVACAPARILIPGSRLWRSAEVTLDAQLAAKITVLPNMEGVIADFDEVQIPNPLSNSDEDTRPDEDTRHLEVPARLRIWTSEGMDEASSDVHIRLPKDESSRCPQTAVSTPDPSVPPPGPGNRAVRE
jgi:hypothetical protein